MRMTPVRLAALYVVLGAAWILLSDRLVDAALPAELAQPANTIKGWAFVAVTGVLLYLLTRSALAQVVAERDAARAAARTAARATELAREHEAAGIAAREALQRSVARLAGLHALDRDILASVSIEAIAQRGCRHLRGLIPAERAAILLYDPDREMATLAAVDEDDPAPETAAGSRFPMAASVPALVLAGHGPHVFPDMGELRDFAPARALMARGYRTSLFAPLRVDGALLGFVVMGARTPGTFSEEHTAIAEEVANQLAIAFRTATARRALADREARLAAILDGSPNAIITVDRDGIVRYANPRAAEIFGAPRGGLEGRPATELIPEAHAAAHPQQMRDWFDTPSPSFDHPLSTRARRLDGRLFAAQVLLSSVETNDGRMAIVTVVDLTQREALEARLRQVERTETIGRFAGILAHDVRNYLTAVQWSADLLAGSMDADDPRMEDVELIRRAVEGGVAMTRSVLDFARPADDAVGTTDVGAHLAATRPLLDRMVGALVTCEIVVDPGLPPAGIAGAALTQVLVNLASNARDAMPDGGRFRIEASERTVAAGDPDAGLLRAGRYVRFRVSDTGVGMDEETRAHVFEAFYTTKAAEGPGAGTGLGLSSAFLIVGRTGGTIDVTSEPGRGTTFTIDLPAAA